MLYQYQRKVLFVTPRGRLPYERGGVLVVLLRGVNLGFWYHLGYSEQNAIVFSRQGLV